MGTKGADRRDPNKSAVREQGVRLNPGDEAPPGTPGTGEATCPQCNGAGRVGASSCPHCGGSGKVIKAIGGA